MASLVDQLHVNLPTWVTAVDNDGWSVMVVESGK